MKIFNNTKIPKNFKGSALAIGNFDGVHVGHKKVFQQTKKIAKKIGATGIRIIQRIMGLILMVISIQFIINGIIPIINTHF